MLNNILKILNKEFSINDIVSLKISIGRYIIRYLSSTEIYIVVGQPIFDDMMAKEDSPGCIYFWPLQIRNRMDETWFDKCSKNEELI